jgi:hypothetical protein
LDVSATLLVFLVTAVVFGLTFLVCILSAFLWNMTKKLSWRVTDLENAVRQLQDERSRPDDEGGGGSTAIRK